MVKLVTLKYHQNKICRLNRTLTMAMKTTKKMNKTIYPSLPIARSIDQGRNLWLPVLPITSTKREGI